MNLVLIVMCSLIMISTGERLRMSRIRVREVVFVAKIHEIVRWNHYPNLLFDTTIKIYISNAVWNDYISTLLFDWLRIKTDYISKKEFKSMKCQNQTEWEYFHFFNLIHHKSVTDLWFHVRTTLLICQYWNISCFYSQPL